jgi:hypothetical protein
MRHCPHQFPIIYFIFLCNMMSIHTKTLQEIFSSDRQLSDVFSLKCSHEWFLLDWNVCPLKRYILMFSSLLGVTQGRAHSLDGAVTEAVTVKCLWWVEWLSIWDQWSLLWSIMRKLLQVLGRGHHQDNPLFLYLSLGFLTSITVNSFYLNYLVLSVFIITS